MSSKLPITLKKFTEAQKQAEYSKMIKQLKPEYTTDFMQVMQGEEIIGPASEYILNDAPKNIDLQNFMIQKFNNEYGLNMDKYIRHKIATDEEGTLGGGKRRRRSKRRRRRPSTKKRVRRKSRRTKSRRSKTRRRSKRRSRRN